MLCFKKISVISYVPIAYSKIKTKYVFFLFQEMWYSRVIWFRTTSFAWLLTFVVSNRISKLILYGQTLDYVISHHTPPQLGKHIIMRWDVLWDVAHILSSRLSLTLILRSEIIKSRLLRSTSYLRNWLCSWNDRCS